MFQTPNIYQRLKHKGFDNYIKLGFQSLKVLSSQGNAFV